MKTRTSLVAGMISLCLLANFAAAASPWSARLRATYLQTADKSDAFSALGINFGSDAISVSDRLIPEIDLAYAFTDVFSAELVLTIPQKHRVALAGVGGLGSFKHLPPTLLFQYRANPGGNLRPYVGVGINYTLIYGEHLAVAGVPLRLDNSSVGAAAQLGVDYTVDARWAINADLKYAGLKTDVYAGGARLTEVRVDPWLYSLGVRYAF